MNCPYCGSQTISRQQYCRSCGASLQSTTQALTGGCTVGKDGFHSVFGSGLLGIVVMFIGASVGVVGKMILHVDIITAIGVLVSFAGMLLSAYPYLLLQRRLRHNIVPSSPPDSLVAAQPTKKLPPVNNADFIASVTESTTDLLKEPAVTRS